MEFVVIIDPVLQGSIAPSLCVTFHHPIIVRLFSIHIGARLDRLKVDAENEFSSVTKLRYELIDVLAKQSSLFPAQIELPTCDEMGN